jgi:hemoglobin
MATTFERIGGEPAIGLVVDKFYDFVLADPKTSPFFKGTDMVKQRKSQKAFITMVNNGLILGSGRPQRLSRQGYEISSR